MYNPLTCLASPLYTLGCRNIGGSRYRSIARSVRLYTPTPRRIRQFQRAAIGSSCRCCCYTHAYTYIEVLRKAHARPTSWRAVNQIRQKRADMRARAFYVRRFVDAKPLRSFIPRVFHAGDGMSGDWFLDFSRADNYRGRKIWYNSAVKGGIHFLLFVQYNVCVRKLIDLLLGGRYYRGYREK